MNGKVQRQTYIDIAKGIGIILVVFGHSFGASLFAAKLYHMPLFFFLSGITFRAERSFFGFLKRRIQRLYIPFLIYEVVYLLLSPIFYRIGIVSTCPGTSREVVNLACHIALFDNVNILLSPLWFVTALFFSQMMMFGIERLVSRITYSDRYCQIIRILCGGGLLYFGLWIGSQRLFFVSWSFNFEAEIGVILEAAAYGLFGTCFGLWLRRKEKSESEKNNPQRDCLAQKKRALGIILLLLFVGMVAYERILRPAADMRSNIYDYWPLAPVFALLGITCVVFLSRSITAGSVINKSLCCFGRHSFAIMCLHPLMFKLVGLLQVHAFGYDKEKLPDWQMVSTNPIWLGIAALTGMMLPILLVWGCDCVKYKLIPNKII